MFILLVISSVFGCGHNQVDSPPERLLSPDEILRDSRLDLLSDEPYYLPANENEEDETVYLPLKKWDLIFVGAMKPGLEVGEDPAMLSKLIPGKYDHVLVYTGKDMAGFAYAVELNTDRIYLEGMTPVVLGGMRFLCLGKDFAGELHPSGKHVADRDLYGIRWARTFEPENREKLKEADVLLVARVMDDMATAFPYQLEFGLPPNLLTDRTVLLVDDGRRNGAGCADYWTSLFEEFAGVCMKGTRISADELTDYFLNDPTGKTASVPEHLNPLGNGDLRLGTLLSLGVRIVEDVPHRFPCDGSDESGLVIPDRIARSKALEEITLRGDPAR